VLPVNHKYVLMVRRNLDPILEVGAEVEQEFLGMFEK
jgi:hypothetical protein